MEVLRASGGVYLEGLAGCGKTSFLIGTASVFFGSSADEVKYLVVTAGTNYSTLMGHFKGCVGGLNAAQCFLLGAG